MGEGSSEDGFDRISIASSISEPVGESQSSESNLQSPAIPVTAHGRYSDTSARSSSLPVGEEDSPDASHRSTSQPVGEGDSYDAASESSRAAVRNSQTERVLDIFDPAYSRPLSSHAAPLNSASGGYGSSSPEVGLVEGPGSRLKDAPTHRALLGSLPIGPTTSTRPPSGPRPAPRNVAAVSSPRRSRPSTVPLHPLYIIPHSPLPPMRRRMKRRMSGPSFSRAP